MLTIKDLLTAFHSLSKTKGYVVTIVLTLGITLGAVVAMFNLNYQLLAAPLPYPDADRLMMFSGERFEKGVLTPDRGVPYPALVELYKREDGHFLQKALLAYTVSIERWMPDSPVLTTVSITPEFLQMLQAPMALGRHFNADEGLDSMNQVAIISHRAWIKYFQQRNDVLGKTLNIMEMEFKIVGVLAEDFIEPGLHEFGAQTDLWLPFDYDDTPKQFRPRWSTFNNRVYLVGLMNPHSKAALVEQETSHYIAARFKEEASSLAGMADTELKIRLKTFDEIIHGNASRQSLWMLAGVLVLLLIASTNIINLILARAANQQRTMAIQIALGAQKQHIFNGVLAEILWLVSGASIIALAVSFIVIELLKTWAEGQLPRLNELQLNPQTLLFALATGILLALLFATLVSRQINYRALNNLLQTSGKGVGLQINKKIRNLLIVSQVALTGILLAASLHILVQSVSQLTQPLGYNTDDQYQVRLSIATLWETKTKEERREYFYQLADALRAHPSVEAVGMASRSPVDYSGPSYQSLLTEPGNTDGIRTLQNYNDGNYFKILAFPLVTGRYFTDAEARNNEDLLVVNETLARQLQADGKVVGRLVYLASDASATGFQIVGVIKDLQLPGQTEPPRFFLPAIVDSPAVVIQTKPKQQLTAQEINQIAATINPQLKVFDIRTTADAISELTAHQKTAASLTAVLALLALTLAGIGLYGVLSYSVQQRRFELGVRMAIGARPFTIFAQVLRDNVLPVAVGLVASLVILAGLWLWIQQTSFTLHTSFIGWLMPVLLILTLASAASLLSVWNIITRPASHLLKND
jgi:putative ABC transport system permease protein